jgi:type IV secretory pathway VirB10-like protein
MSEKADAPGTAAVTDHRTPPRGVLPRHLQTWVMAGLAVGIVLVILLVGQPEPPTGTTPASVVPQTPNADRVRDYQDRMRTLEAQALRELQAAEQAATQPPVVDDDAPTRPAPEDPIAADRRRREYESLFASNVAVSRRPDHERPDVGAPRPSTGGPANPAEASLDEVADAVMRATVRAGAPALTPRAATAVDVPPDVVAHASPRGTPASTDPIRAAGPQHRLLEGTLIDTVLTNRLEGSAAAPVNLLVTNPIYSHSGHQIVIPAGARILGETRPVQSLGESRLAVALHRLIQPDGRTYRLDQFMGLNQIGDAGLRDKVNHHYWSTFGAAGAVGLISGLAQWIGTAGLARGDGDRTVVIAGGATDATAQASMQMMNRFLNRLPTVTIREGHRVKVYLTSDLDLPAFERAGGPGRF